MHRDAAARPCRLRDCNRERADAGLVRADPPGAAGSVDGINLFFGALIGANLGTLEGVKLRDYAIIIALLAGTVTALRLVSLSDRESWRSRDLLCGSPCSLPSIHFRLVPAGLAQDDLDRLAVTIAIWVASVLAFELSPVRDDDPVRPAEAPTPPLP